MKRQTKADLKNLTASELEQLAADCKSQMDAVHHINHKHGNTPEYWTAAIKQ